MWATLVPEDSTTFNASVAGPVAPVSGQLENRQVLFINAESPVAAETHNRPEGH